MEYKNTKTGAIIKSPCIIRGGDWVEVKEEAKKAPNQEQLEQQLITDEKQGEVDQEDAVSDNVSDEVDPDEENQEDNQAPELAEITVKQIKQELDAFGIEYDKNAKKKELYDLMIQGK